MSYFNKHKLAILVLVIFLFPNFAKAVTCSPVGYSVFTINGINTDINGATENRDALKKLLLYQSSQYKNQKITVDFLHNKSHGKIIDALDTTNQIYFDENSLNIQDADFARMLTDASAKLTTQKVLLISHSQGNFYANTFYDAVADEPGGVPSMSIGVYGVASPASRVAGGGLYLTSDTDRMIIGTVAKFPLTNTLKPNTHINFNSKDDSLGHSFSKTYLTYEGNRIISDIKTSLEKLKENDEQVPQDPCISPPKLTWTQKIQGGVLTFTDPVSIPLQASIVYVSTGSYQIASAIGHGILNGIDALASAISSLAQSIFNNTRDLAINNTATVINATNDTNSVMAESVSPNNTAKRAEATSQPPPSSPQSENIPVKNSAPAPVAEATPPPSSSMSPVAVMHDNGGGVTGTSSALTSQPESEPVPPVPTPEPPAPLAPPVPPVPPAPPDTTAPDIPTVNVLSQFTNTDNVVVTGTAEADSTITITGGANIATGIATGGNFSVSVPLNQNVLNTLSVTATDGSNNTSNPATVSTTHDNLPPVVFSMAFNEPPTNVMLVGRSFTLNINTDASGYTAGAITINEVSATDFRDNRNNIYTVTHTVAFGETDRTSGAVPVSVVLTDAAGNNSNVATQVVGNGLVIKGHYPDPVMQVSPSFDINTGKFTQDVTLPCITSSGYFEMYYVTDSDSFFHFMNTFAGVDIPYTVNCPSNQKIVISSGQGFDNFGGYAPVAGWYYGVVSIGDPKCDASKNDMVCVNDNIQSFFRLHRSVTGVWTDTDN